MGSSIYLIRGFERERGDEIGRTFGVIYLGSLLVRGESKLSELSMNTQIILY